jgi:hypothetical protein
MIPDTTHHTLRIETYVREDLRGATDRIEDVLGRLERLSEGEGIESFSVESWESRTEPSVEGSATRPQSEVRRTVDEFEDWAARHGYSLGPAVDRSDVKGIEVPVICVAIYEDDELLAVYPHTNRRGDVRTVEDGLDALARSRSQ